MDFSLVDVFGVEDFSGNPVAVVHDATELSTEQMQGITRWLNLSETTFLLPPTDPQADYHVRIFTLDREMPFAGHPTLGTAHAWLEAGGAPGNPDEIVQECGAGLVPLRRNEGRLAFATPPLIRSGPVDEEKLAEIAGVLGIARDRIVDAAWADNGPGWAAVLLGSAEEVLALEPARHHASRMEIGVVGPYSPGHDAAYEVRAIFSDAFGGLLEDPVTGSLNASVAQWMLESGRVAGPYKASQGARLGRTGRVSVEQADGQIWIGGQTKTLFQGSATF
jgi:PhzF family phenazine biosynthesis protein